MVLDLSSSDDTAALQAAINSAPVGGCVRIPNGTHTISKALDDTKRVTLDGESTRDTVIKCAAPGLWSGTEMIRNWTDGDWFLANDGKRPNVTASPQYYPRIRNLRLDTNGNPGVTCIAWVHMQETGFLRDLAFRADSGGCIAVALYANDDAEGSHNGGEIYGVTGYGAGWKHELLADVRGSDLQVTAWTTANKLHADSCFKIKCIGVTMSRIHAEAWLDDTALANVAIFEVAGGSGFVLRDSLYSLHADMPRPLVAARNPHGAGYGYSAPLLDGIKIHNEASAHRFTGAFLVDDTQPANARQVLVEKPTFLYRYDGRELVYADGSNGSIVRVVYG